MAVSILDLKLIGSPLLNGLVVTIAANGDASGLTSGTIPAARLAARSLADIGTRSATDLTSGTLPDARFPATLPAASGTNLTALNATNLASGTVADARLSANVMTLTGAQTVSGLKTFTHFSVWRNALQVFQPDAATTDTAFNSHRWDVNGVGRWSMSVRASTSDHEFWIYNQTLFRPALILETASNSVRIGQGGSLRFEGATDDANRTTLTVVDPTAARTITLPNATGTVALLDIAQTYSAINTYTAGVIVGTTGATVLGVRSNSASLDFASIAAGAEATLTITVAGAVTTNTPSVALGWSAVLPDGIIVKQAHVSAADTVSIRVANVTAGAIDPAAVTCRVVVTQF